MPRLHVITHAWFLSRSAIRTTRSICASSNSGFPAKVCSGRNPIPCVSMFACGYRRDLAEIAAEIAAEMAHLINHVEARYRRDLAEIAEMAHLINHVHTELIAQLIPHLRQESAEVNHTSTQAEPCHSLGAGVHVASRRGFHVAHLVVRVVRGAHRVEIERLKHIK